MLLADKRIVILNIANKRSIAWAIAKQMDAHGAQLILGCQNERMRKNLDSIVNSLVRPPLAIVECDVSEDADITRTAEFVREAAGTIHGLVHCLAYAPREALGDAFVDTKRAHFHTAMSISAYSLVALTRALRPLFADTASILALSYLGAQRVVPNYNVMGVAKAALEASIRYLAYDLGPSGVRVNGISAGPVNTLAARGVSGFVDMLDKHQHRTPLRRNIDIDEVATAAVFLASSLSSGITGETMFVDAGYNTMGMAE